MRPRFKTTDNRPIQVENYFLLSSLFVFHSIISSPLAQIQIHVTVSPARIGATILLNKLRLIGLFDLLLSLKSFVFDSIPEKLEMGN